MTAFQTALAGFTQFTYRSGAAFALKINRTQGQSAKKCGILLPKNVWTHGQIHVAFSRCGNPRNVFVWAEQSQLKDFDLDPSKRFVKNVVHREVV